MGDKLHFTNDFDVIKSCMRLECISHNKGEGEDDTERERMKKGLERARNYRCSRGYYLFLAIILIEHIVKLISHLH
jgi:hypothetical protein